MSSNEELRQVEKYKTASKGDGTMKHYLTKYHENGKHYAESWLQINIFGKCFCFSRRRIQVGGIK